MKTTLEMAREAGLHIPYWAEEEDPKKDPPRWTMISSLPPLLEAFEALVRADEREVRSMRWDEYIAKAIEAEREACAKVADHYSMHDQDTPADIAEAIRNRGNT